MPKPSRKPAPKAIKRPKDISKSDWDKLSPEGKVRQLRSSGEKEGYRAMSRLAGRQMHAEKSAKRAGEAAHLTKQGRDYASKLEDEFFRAKLGGKRIMRHNKKLLSAGRQVGGKQVLQAGAEETLSGLQKSINEALQFLKQQTAKNAKRAAKRIKP